MKYYKIIFLYKGKKICACYMDGENTDEAMMRAEFSLICKYSNVAYDDVIVEE